MGCCSHKFGRLFDEGGLVYYRTPAYEGGTNCIVNTKAVSLAPVSKQRGIYIILWFYSRTYPQIPELCLQLLVSSNCTWSEHIGSITKKSRRMSGWALSVFRDRSDDTMLTLLKSIVRPQVQFNSINTFNKPLNSVKNKWFNSGVSDKYYTTYHFLKR